MSVERRPAAPPPLAGLKVLDLTRFLAGPFCTMLLADYGADVVKVESRRGREFRVPGSERDTYFFLSSNRGKRSITLDYRSAPGRALLVRMLPHFDVLVENFRPDVMEQLGLGSEALLRRNPRLIYCGISGFGADGPYRDRPGFDQIAQGMSGFMSVTGVEATGPTRAGIAIADLLAGIFAAHGVQLALLARERTGRGQVVHTSLLEALTAILSWSAGMYFESGQAPGPAGHHHPLSSPYGRFKARDGYLNIAAGTPSMWEKLARTLGRDDWIRDPRFADPAARLLHRDALSAEIDAVLAAGSVADWVERINAAGVPCGPVLDMAQVFADAQVLARGMLVELEHPELGTYRTTGLPVKLSASPGRIERRPPLLGEHTDDILAECGLSKREIDRLRRDAVI
ncbi:MAG: CoA transferase [Deltaproteobacteria bacterium]|nr:MAG: CoA transferase [Deltaproteobacteria bacterium]